MTQAELAEEVSLRGVPWRQQTVLKVEKGQRPLRLREAAAVAVALQVGVDVLTGEKPVLDATTMMMTATRGVERQLELFQSSGRDILNGVAHLRMLLSRAARSDIWRDVDPKVLSDAATLTQIDLAHQVEGILAAKAARGPVIKAEYDRALPAKSFDPEEWL
jgi:hypothetical protein